MKLHEKIRKMREFKDCSQDYVARKLGVSQEAYGKVEQGRTHLTIDRLQAIAAILEVDPLHIIDLHESDFYRQTHSVASAHNPHQAIPDSGLTDRERALYEQRIQELKESLDWQRQQNQVLSQQVAKMA